MIEQIRIKLSNESKQQGVKRMILRYIAGTIIGGVLGFLYYKIVGCRTGSCPITSSPIRSIIYGAVMGLILA
jgi:F0F1-type ATP synthase assembly protein I